MLGGHCVNGKDFDLSGNEAVTLVVGMAVSLSGQFRVQGRQALAGLQAWARDANALAPDSFTLLHYDDGSDPSTVRVAIQRSAVSSTNTAVGPARVMKRRQSYISNSSNDPQRYEP